MTRRTASGMCSRLFLACALAAVTGFFAGTSVTLHMAIGQCKEKNPILEAQNIVESRVEQLVQQRLQELQASLPHCRSAGNEERPPLQGDEPFSFPEAVKKYAVGMARTAKMDFVNLIDTGVPIDLPKDGDSEVIILYQRDQALPRGYRNGVPGDDESALLPKYEATDALRNCDFVNTVLVDHPRSRNQCIALMPQYESYHVQKWMRLAPSGGKIDSSQALRPVSRGMQANGQNQFNPPVSYHIQQSWIQLSTYFASFKESVEELKVLLEKVASPSKTVTVMVSNFGQSELLVNFVCSAKSRNLDLSNVIVFATDTETKVLAESLGLTAFHDARNFGAMPEEAAGHYGDRKFTAMMMAKVMCVQMVSSLKYNILFQDVDVVWYKNPVEYFENNHLEFDILFQDDGGHTVRYAPYSANTGFYFVRSNARTEYFLSSLLLSGDLILKTDSHQQALIALLSEHVSLFGLRAKVFSRDEDEFPGGYHYHQATGKYLRAFFAGEVHPYIFHMSWTLNKENKLLFLKQMGEWFVNEQCIQAKVNGSVVSEKSSFVAKCCSAVPLISCHYRDKPSKHPCKDSPPIDKGKPSWWK